MNYLSFTHSSDIIECLPRARHCWGHSEQNTAPAFVGLHSSGVRPAMNRILLTKRVCQVVMDVIKYQDKRTVSHRGGTMLGPVVSEGLPEEV